MSRALRRVIAPAFRRAALPLAWYYGVTLALPFANGAAHAGAAFLTHALVVLLVPPGLIVLASAVVAFVSGSIERARGAANSLGAGRSIRPCPKLQAH